MGQSTANSRPLLMEASWFEAFIHHAPALAYIKDIDGRYLFINAAYSKILNVEPESWLGKTDFEIWPKNVARLLRRNDMQVLEKGEPLTTQETVFAPGHENTFHHLVSKFPLYKDGRIMALGGFAVDITKQVEAEKALKLSEDVYRIIADYTYDCEIWKNRDGAIQYVSPSCERITGFNLEQLINDPDLLHKVVHPDDLQAYELHQEKLELGAEASLIEFRVIRGDGRERWLAHFCQRVYDDNDVFLGFRTSSRDITDRKLIEMQLKHQAFHDPLTELPNRSLCLDRISQALERSRRRDNYNYAVIFLDLDRFKIINDSLGHTVGDQLLIATAKRLQQCVRALDTVARIGGDEFVIILEEVFSPGEAIRIIKRIRQEMMKPFYLSGHEAHLSVSLGIVLSGADYENAEDLLRKANIAMHRAKVLGRNRFKVFTKRMLEQAVELLNLETDLRRALENKEFFIQYQPIVSLRDKKLIGFEALVRWRHPTIGTIPPADFIPVAEDSGLILPIGSFVLHEACRSMAQWQDLEPQFREMTMSVNISGKQLSQPDLVDQVREALKASGLPPHCLKLEITESVLMENAEFAVLTMRRLKELGVLISIDDFGTGYSSLSYLQRFPVDTLKVDRGFISEMEEKQENCEIVKAVITLAHSLGLDVVAEGVERELQLQILKKMHCENCQGFLFSQPLDEDQVLTKYFVKLTSKTERASMDKMS